MIEGPLREGARWASGDPLEGVGRWECTRPVDRDGQQLDPPIGELLRPAIPQPLLASVFRCQLLEADLFSRRRADRLHLLVLRDLRRAGDRVRSADVGAGQQRRDRHLGDVGLVNEGVSGRAVRLAHHALGADPLRPSQGVRREHAGPHVGPLQTGVLHGTFHGAVELAARVVVESGAGRRQHHHPPDIGLLRKVDDLPGVPGEQQVHPVDAVQHGRQGLRVLEIAAHDLCCIRCTDQLAGREAPA